MSVVRSLRSASLLSSLLLLIFAGTCLAAGEQQVGVTSAVNPDFPATAVVPHIWQCVSACFV